MGAETHKSVRDGQVDTTRRQILRTAERLFAEEGLYAVSNRQISAAAGQGNNAAVGYHFGTKLDLVRAIVRTHTDRIEALRAEMVTAAAGSAELRDWVACLVRPTTEHLAELGRPTWYARFSAQVDTDPAARAVITEEALAEPALRTAVDGLYRCLPELPLEVRAERTQMMRLLMVHTYAERERSLADGTATPRATWDDAASGLIDAVTGLLRAPVS